MGAVGLANLSIVLRSVCGGRVILFDWDDEVGKLSVDEGSCKSIESKQDWHIKWAMHDDGREGNV